MLYPDFPTVNDSREMLRKAEGTEAKVREGGGRSMLRKAEGTEAKAREGGGRSMLGKAEDARCSGSLRTLDAQEA
jgi:hypothetical protein